MQFKTTAILAVVLLVLMGWFLVERPDQRDTRRTVIPPSDPSSVAQRPVFDDPPANDDIVTVVATRNGTPPWRFDRTEGDDSEWKMVEPIKSTVPKWDVDNIVRTVSDLEYQISYNENDPDGISLQQAGLAPPRLTLTLEDQSGEKLALEVGKPASTSETYVRVAGAGDILVAQRSLDTLLKKSVNEYRDKSLIKFMANETQSLEIVHRPDRGDPIRYRLVKRDDGDWVFEAPFSADADDKTIDAAVASASRLRATEWIDANAETGYRAFGLHVPLVEVAITTQTEIKPKDNAETDADPDGDATPTRTETQRHVFLVSARSPLGKDTSVYCKRPDDQVVAAVSKSIADKFTPVIEDWRDMDVCPTKVIAANRVTLKTHTADPTVLTRNDRNQWIFEDTAARAEDSDVNDLLKSIDDLEALNFVDGADPSDPRFGLAEPTAEIVLHIPGTDQPERITLGATTDANSMRVYYLRRGESPSIAKVRAAEIEKLTREPIEYLNREIIKIATSDLKSIQLTRPNAHTAQSESLTLTYQDGGWSITDPVDAATEPAIAVKLATTLADLRAEQVVTLSGAPAEYGLENPTVTLTMTYQGPAVISVDDAPQPPAPQDHTLVLHIAENNGTLFAKRGDTPAVYQLRRIDYNAILADFHDKNVLDFEQSHAISVSITTGNLTHGFTKKDDTWVYTSEPDLPIDPKKVTNLLLQLQDLKLERYVAYAATDLSAFGLDKPATIVRVKTDEGHSMTLLVSAPNTAKTSRGGAFAVIVDTADVFLLTPDNVARLNISLDDFEKPADS